MSILSYTKKCVLLSYLTTGTMAGYMLYDLSQSDEVDFLTGQPEGYPERGRIGRLFYAYKGLDEKERLSASKALNNEN